MEAAASSGVTARPFDVTGLPRIRGKQEPFGGWEQMDVKPKEKQVAPTKGKGTKTCPGRSGQPCSFGKNGQAAWRSRGHEQCMWCSPERLLEACDRRANRGGLVKSFKNMSEEQQGRAMALVPEKFRAYFVEVASKQARCRGHNGAPCVFAESAAGGKAKVNHKKPQCLFCDVELLAQQCSTQTGRSKVLTRLRRMAPASRQKAVEARIPEEHRQYFQDVLIVPGEQDPAGAQRASRLPGCAVALGSPVEQAEEKRSPTRPACHHQRGVKLDSSCMSGAAHILGACAASVIPWCLCL